MEDCTMRSRCRASAGVPFGLTPRPSVLALFALFVVGLLAPAPREAAAFCGFYVAQGDAKLFNHVSKVIVARNGERTVMTMSSDFEGDPAQFAVVIPVPVVPLKEQVHIGDPAWVDHIDQYSVPRLVEYTDPNPCPAKVSADTHYRGGRASTGT